MKNILSISIASVIAHGLALAEKPAAPAPMPLDETIISAPLARTLFEQAQPVFILKGDRLLLALQPTLGETLSRTPGVRSTYYGPAASRPIIRGQDGDRIRILQNGSNTIDASAPRVSTPREKVLFAM